MAIFAIQNGISNILIGYSQSYTLSPSIYSFDFDNVATLSSLQFKFYCTSITSGVTPTLTNIDLATYKSNSGLRMTLNQTCFASNG